MEVEESCFLISSLLSKTTYDIKSLFELTVQSTGHHYGEVEAAAASRQLAHHICNQKEIIANRCIHAPLLHRHSPGSQPASDTTQLAGLPISAIRTRINTCRPSQRPMSLVGLDSARLRINTNHSITLCCFSVFLVFCITIVHLLVQKSFIFI